MFHGLIAPISCIEFLGLAGMRLFDFSYSNNCGKYYIKICQPFTSEMIVITIQVLVLNIHESSLKNLVMI